ncbi:hypothetical protein Tco_0659218 [Tanacetum coccineum]
MQLLFVPDTAIQEMSARRANVEVRRMEGINLKVMYDTWRRIYVKKYVQIDRPPPEAKGISLLFGSPFGGPSSNQM